MKLYRGLQEKNWPAKKRDKVRLKEEEVQRETLKDNQ
jgi:hypothetical protein